MAQQRSQTRYARLVGWLDRLPRLRRVLLSLGITVEFVILASLVIDRLLIDSVLSGDVHPLVPAWVAAGLGVVFYGIGWWALVGFDFDADHPWRAGNPAGLYVTAGLLALALLAVLVLFGMMFGYVL
jgi:hypothetical protein